ncbi:MAG: sulfurtransferase [Litorimonas sp.]
MHSSLVDVGWLGRNFGDPNLIVLDASPISNMANLKVLHPGLRIIGARPFNLKDHFSNKQIDLPNMMPSSEAFTKASQSLGINTESKLVIYDNLGLYSAPRAWWMLTVMGHKNVAVLDGGLNDWISAGGATEPISEEVYTPGNFVSRFDSGKVKTAKQVRQNIESKEFVVVDARSSGRFHAKVPEPRAGSRRGHIPESYNLPYTKLLDGGKLRPKQQLEALFDALDLGEAPLVFTCGSGMTAAINLLAATLVLENELGLYDGSWSEWGAADGVWPIR